MNPIAKRTVTALTLAAILICIIIYTPAKCLMPVIYVLGALVILEFGQLLAKKCRPLSPGFILGFAAGAVVLGGSFWMLTKILAEHGNLWLLYILAIIKISDMGGFAFGLSSAKFMKGGNHKLCPTISPNKSWEGLGGSIFGSCLVSGCFIPITGMTFPVAMAFGVAAALVGTFGDLVESKFKRWVGVKDSSTMKITNGMGGFLDMFDSLIFAPALFYFFI